MNILPKKRWHVRTKDNIARVRRDEAEAAEQTAANEKRAKLADKEARLQFMRTRALKWEPREPKTGSDEFSSQGEMDSSSIDSNDSDLTPEAINLLKELGSLPNLIGTNKEHEREKKEEKERYEKQFGYLTFLGQSSKEATGKKSWYDVAPDRGSDSKEEKDSETKSYLDPLSKFPNHLKRQRDTTGETQEKPSSHAAKVRRKHHYDNSIGNLIRGMKHLPLNDDSDETENHSSEDETKQEKRPLKRKSCASKSFAKGKRGKKVSLRKRRKKPRRDSDCSSSESDGKEQRKFDVMKTMRDERLRREEMEKYRSEALLAELRGEAIPEPPPSVVRASMAMLRVNQEYNAQFNPQYARQNKN